VRGNLITEIKGTEPMVISDWIILTKNEKVTGVKVGAGEAKI